MSSQTPQTVARVIDTLQGGGRYSVTRAELLQQGRRTETGLDQALRRLRREGRLVSPRRGFYVIVPVEYRGSGGPPFNWFIDALMGFLGQPYYVGLLTAAMLHGAAHQQPMVTRVITDRPTRPVRAGRVRISFHVSRDVKAVPVTRVTSEVGTIAVSTPEVTALDIVRFHAVSGYMSNVATVLSELAERMDLARLVAAARFYATPVLQRLGFLLEVVKQDALAAGVSKALGGRRYRTVLLVPGGRDRAGDPHPSWRVVQNTPVEPEA